MKIRELIDLLQKVEDGDMPVEFYTYGDGDRLEIAVTGDGPAVYAEPGLQPVLDLSRLD